MASDNKVLFQKEGVFIHTTVASADEEALVAGKIYLIEKPEGVFVEWKPVDDGIDVKSTSSENEWHMVEDTVAYHRSDKNEGAVSVNKSPKQKTTPHKYVVNFDVHDLKSFKRSRPNLGWSYLIFILKCGTTCPALHFHQGGTKAFMKEMEKFLSIKRSPADSCLYLVREHDPAALSRSFDELQLFEEQANDILTKPGFFAKKFIRDPYTTTLGGFSKVTNFLRDSLMTHEHDRPPEDMVPAIPEEIEGIDINNSEEPGFEMITTVDLPERPTVKRSEPLTPQQWSQHMDQEGKVIDVDKIKMHIFRGGIEPTIRIEVWKFLLDYYSWDSTYKMRTEQRKKKVDDYFRMKLQWKSVTPDQERRFSWMKERKNLIDKDVTRTDRTHQFFQGEDNPNLQVLYDILMTYCMYNFDLGYVQGMSDLLAPILVVMENEVDAFWCFAGFMERVHDNFEMTQEGMKTQLQQLNTLVKFVDPQLCNYLESQDSSNMYFCFRWLLIMFKREFSFPDIMRLWEVMWTGLPCLNWHLLICIAMLDSEKTVLMENNFGFTEILKHINDMSCTLEVDEVLRTAEAINLQLRQCRNLPTPMQQLLGFSEDTSSVSSSSTSNSSFALKIPPGGNRAGTQHSPVSTPSSPERSTVSLRAVPNGINGSESSASRVTTPSDASIEILHPDNIDMGV